MFAHEMHCGAKDEATYDSYSADIRACAAPAPKTDGERLKEQLKQMEIAESSGGSSAGSAGANVAFPLSSQAKAAIAKIKDGSALWMNAFHVRMPRLLSFIVHVLISSNRCLARKLTPTHKRHRRLPIVPPSHHQLLHSSRQYTLLHAFITAGF